MLESFTASVLRQSVPRISRKSGFVPKKRHASYCKLCLLNWLKTLCLCCTQQVFSKALIWQWRALCVWWISPPKPVRLQSKHSYCGCDIIFVLVRNTSVCGWTCAERLENPSNWRYVVFSDNRGAEVSESVDNLLACLSAHAPVHNMFSLMSPGGELLASACDEWRAHGATLPAVLPVGLGTSCSGHHHPGHRVAWRLWVDNTCRVRIGARRCVSVRRTNSTIKMCAQLYKCLFVFFENILRKAEVELSQLQCNLFSLTTPFNLNLSWWLHF